MPQELSEVIIVNDEFVESDQGPKYDDFKDEDETPYHSFVQDTGNEPLEVDRLHPTFFNDLMLTSSQIMSSRHLQLPRWLLLRYSS